MADHPFEDQAADLFASAPAFDDAEAFAASVEMGLENYMRLRRRVLGAVTAVAVAVAVVLIARSSAFADLQAALAGVGIEGESLGEQLARTPIQVWTLLAAAMALGGWLYGRSSLAR